MYPREPHFANALRSVVLENYTVDAETARELIERVYAIRGNETGDAFRALFDRVIGYLKIAEEHQRGYQLILGRYFNARAVEALKKDPEKRRGPWIPVVLSADCHHVRFQVYPELKVTFRPKKGAPHRLSGRDISITEREVLSGSEHVGKATYAELLKKAIAILNDKRELVAAG